MLTIAQRPARTRRLAWLAAGALATLVATRWGNDALIACCASRADSRSTGTPAHGALAHGRRLPSRGANFETCSDLLALLGRNSVHVRVRDAVLDAYGAMARERPDVRFVYGETSWPSGGAFWPHHTHQNGLSVDFFVPVRDAATGRGETLSTTVLQRFGYAHEFDRAGREGDVAIDFDAMAAHLAALDRAARAHGLRIARVIFDPALQPRLFATRAGAPLRTSMPWMTRAAWVRHDEHYHVDFALE